jgi:hypothetical protein
VSHGQSGCRFRKRRNAEEETAIVRLDLSTSNRCVAIGLRARWKLGEMVTLRVNVFLLAEDNGNELTETLSSVHGVSGMRLRIVEHRCDIFLVAMTMEYICGLSGLHTGYCTFAIRMSDTVQGRGWATISGVCDKQWHGDILL